ncbi:MAG: DUF1508 domain-containing protein [Burkholderiaceae bacterium]|nr:DUF1508 domain-containing protein [Burkholderiaceae bacterium]
MSAKFVISSTSNGKFHFVLKAVNGETILASQTYAQLASARNGVDSVRRNAGRVEMYERLTSSRGEPYFTLKGGNGQVIGTSEMYGTTRSRDSGIESVKTNAPRASVDEPAAGKG